MFPTPICRACLNTGYEMVFLELSDSMKKLFQYCIGIQLETTLQGYLCGSCAELIQKYAEYKKKCLEVDSCYRAMKIEVLEADNELKPEIKSDIIEECSVVSPQEWPEQEIILDTETPQDKSNEEIELQNPDLVMKCPKKAEIKDSNKTAKVFKCKFCCRKIEIFLESHKKTCKKKKIFPDACGLCDFKNNNDIIVKNHVKKHYKDNMLDCSLCAYAGRDFADMVAHCYVHLNEEWIYYNYFCPCCDMKFISEIMLAFHFRSVHLKKIGGLCNFCNRAIASYKIFQKHIRFHKVDGFICDHCNKKFVFRKELITHLQEVAGVKPFVCDTCGMAFKKIWLLTGHIKKVHTKHKPAICIHCGRRYKSEELLKKHLHSLTRQKQFQCDHCSQSFLTKEQVKSHLFSHTQQKPHECKFCHKKFTTKSYLKIHVKFHMGLNPFKCHECDMEFNRTRDLLKHSFVHDPRRQLQCPICPEKAFYYSSKLRKHCKEVHNLVPSSVVTNEWVLFNEESEETEENN